MEPKAEPETHKFPDISLKRTPRERNSSKSKPKEKSPELFTLGIAPPGLDRRPQADGATKKNAHRFSGGHCPSKKAAALSAAVLPLLGSNQDSPDPESGVLPVTPRGIATLFPPRAHQALDPRPPAYRFMELRGIEPLTAAVRLQRSPS